MNLEAMAALARDDVTTVAVVHNHRFDPDYAEVYDYKILRSLADAVDKGDLVVCRNFHGCCVAQVVEVHDEPRIDTETNINYRWAFQLVDTPEIERLESQDRKLVEHLRKVQRKHQKNQVLAAMGVDSEEVRKLLGNGE